MRTNLLLLFILLFNLTGRAQQLIWETPVSVVNQQLEYPKATVVGKIDADFPEDGTVVVRFDGYCSSSPGDRIVVAASDYDSWQTNYGNLGIGVYDSIRRAQSFSHSRIYNVTKGSRSFYAVAHNFVDTDGDGIATIQGRLTVEFYPAASRAMSAKGIGNVIYPLVMGTEVVVLDSVSVSNDEMGSVLLTADGSYYSLQDNETEIAINKEPYWPNGDGVITVSTASTYITKCFVMRRNFEIPAGSHKFYILARKTKGDPETNQNAFYYNFIATFSSFEAADVTGTISSNDTLPTSLVRLSFNAPAAGKVLVHATGSIRQSGQKALLFGISDQILTQINDTTLVTDKIHENYDSELFSASHVFEVQKGDNDFYLYGAFANKDPFVSVANIKGLMTIQFVGDEVISALSDEKTDEPGLQIFPNPTTALVYLKSDSTGNQTQCVTVADVNGRIVHKAVITSGSLSSMDLSHLTSGLYTVTILTEKNQISQKLLKL